MQQSATLYMFLTQLRAMRALFCNPKLYAVKLVNDSPDKINHGTPTSVQQDVYEAVQHLLPAVCPLRYGVPWLTIVTTVGQSGHGINCNPFLHRYDNARRTHSCSRTNCHQLDPLQPHRK